MSFGHALYYPHISLTNKNWLKYALLYWDKISRIVPTEVQPEDSEDIIRLCSETDFIQNYAPDSSEVKSASDNFFRWLSMHIEMDDLNEYYLTRFGPHPRPQSKAQIDLVRRMEQVPVFRPGRHKGIIGALHEAAITRGEYIHAIKLAPHLKEYLLQTGIAVQGEHEWEDWVRMDSEIGFLYMSYMARTISDKTGRSVVTDEVHAFGASEILRSSMAAAQRDELSYHLGNLMIASYGPKDMNALTFDKILAFRRKHDDDRRVFFDHVNDLCRRLPEIRSEEEFKDALNHKEASLKAEAENLKRQFEGMRIEPVFRFLNISLPTTVAALSQYTPDETKSIVFLAGALLGVANVIQEHNKAKREASDHPLSYLLSLQAGMGTQSMLNKLRSAFRVLH